MSFYPDDLDTRPLTTWPGTLTPDDDVLVRRAKAKAHPDRHGGRRGAWDRVEAALDVLGLLQ